eukprot:CAMPEP_0206047442 /NCGR_PEP_ID=MMETSP1466-20131121/21274_1 /ASSEMBLY_ACC=CAM_ASM_001126 /TAXON_ID=44452 /ORGANISM="Pavlova gyrans, Strain CCMP608" /LENGTH=360 /DNA_ID=CAMNT_0053422457 /DNA_START=1 /DNA_END=1083 /DNA_ORIENTATION=+
MSAAAGASAPPRVLICGGGIIGASTAYYLSKRGCKPIIVERCEIAAAASGKAGGFLAKDWNDGSPVGPLTRASYDLHKELAEEFGADTIDYRTLSCIAVAVAERPAGSATPKKLQGVDWADLGARGSRPMGDESTIAQVHPHKLTSALARAVRDAGGEVRIGTVQEIEPGGTPRVRVDGAWMDADAVIVAMGPWTNHVAGSLGLPPVLGQKYHSVLMQAERTLDQAVFFQGKGDPEVYPRPRGEVYVTGFPDAPGLVKEMPGAVEVRAEVANRLESVGRELSTELRDAPRTKAQSCHLPICSDGMPVIGPLPKAPGVFVATGHSCWGILNAPATGKALAELIIDGKASCVSIDAFAPGRF